jgi:catechol 2,3-dioxygenase-like lactoylglutathione lyase family enzyme
MLAYATLGSNDLEKAKTFYDQLLAVAGLEKRFDHPSGGRVYGSGASVFGVLGPHDGQPATVGNGSMFGFVLGSRDQVDAFHAKALELGGRCDGPPGLRAPNAYFAYVRDLEGNKLCTYCMG